MSSVDLAVLVDAGHELVVALFGLDFVWEPFLEEGGHFVVEVVCFTLVILNLLWCVSIGLTRVRIEYGRFATEWTVVLLVVLHDDQASNAEDVVASELDRAPFDLHAHGTGVVVDLGDVAQDLGVYFGTDGFGEMF